MDVNDLLGFRRINFDDSPKDFKPGDIVDALGMRIGVTSEGQNGNAEVAKGNIKIENSLLPAGKNTCIGSHEDKSENSLFFFVYNDRLDHCIFRYYHTEGTIVLVKMDSSLGFTATDLITGIDYVNDLLYWTNYALFPCKINVKKAIEKGKLRESNIYFTRADVGRVNDYSIKFIDDSGVEMTTIYFSTPIASDIFDASQKFANAYNAAATDTIKLIASVEANGNYVKVIFKTGYEGAFSIIISSTTTTAYLVPQNYYPSPFIERYIDAAKYPICKEPVVTYKKDSSRVANYVKNKIFQFKTRLIYDDHEKSVTSPISNIALDAVGFNSNLSNNYIEVDFSDNRFDNASFAIVKKVEILVREHNTGLFKSVVTLNPADFIDTYKYKFYNDGNYPAIVESESNLLYHNVPLLAKSQKIVKNRLYYGGTKKGYDNIAVDASVTPIYREAPSSNLYTISGRIGIKNDNNGRLQPIHNMGQGPIFGGFGDSTEEEEVGADGWGQTIPLGGFVMYLAGTTHKGVSIQRNGVHAGIQIAGVYDSLTDNEYLGSGNIRLIREDMDRGVWSDFKIIGVPAGKYILRIASHLTTQDELNLPGIEYQKTSTYVTQVGGVSSTEIVLDVTSDMVIGDTYIKDLSAVNTLEQGYAVSGYLTDMDLVSPVPEGPNLLNDTRIENARVLINSALTTDEVAGDKYEAFTDHNGFFWGYFTFNAFDIDRELSIYYVTSSGFVLNPGIYDMSGTPFSLDTIERGSAKVVILRNTNGGLKTKGRTVLIGLVNNNDTQEPVFGISVISTKTGRVAKTDERGRYELTIYGDRDAGKAGGTLNYGYKSIATKPRSDVVYMLSTDINSFVTFDHPSTPYSISINESPLLYNDQSVAGHYLVRQIQATIIGVDAVSSFKHGFTGQFGIIYYDKANRSTYVNTTELMKTHITFQTENKTDGKGLVQISWQIKNLPPAWATHYQWCRTKDSQASAFLQFVAKNIRYVDDTSTEQSYASATRYKIDINNITDYQAKHPNSRLGYVFAAGDRIRFIKNGNGSYFGTYVDLEIIKSESGFVYVAKSSDIGAITAGALFEIYTPKGVDQDLVYYEFGECYEVLTDPATGIKYHQKGAGKTSVNQDPLNPISTPATGTFKTGDVYIRVRSMSTVDNGERLEYVEDQAVSDFFLSKDQSIGRVNELNEDARQEERGTEICFSGIYIQDTKVNGFNAFEPLNRKQLTDSYGLIMKLILAGEDVLISLHYNSKTVTMYIEQAVFKDVNGQQVVAIADDVIGTVTPLKDDFGTQNPESHFENMEGHHFFIDRRKKTAVRYATNGLFPISNNKGMTNMRNKSTDLSLFPDKDVKIPGVCDKDFKEYIICMNPVGEFPGHTISYSDINEGYTSRWPYLPEYFGMVNTSLVSFKDGELWLHNRNELRCNFYGVQYKPIVRVLSNVNYDKVKIWNAISISSNNKWYCTEAITEENRMFENTVMKTSMSLSKIKGKEGKYYTEFNRDINTPSIENPIINGRRMRSQAIEVELTTDETTPTAISMVGIDGTISQKS